VPWPHTPNVLSDHVNCSYDMYALVLYLQVPLAIEAGTFQKNMGSPSVLHRMVICLVVSCLNIVGKH